MKFKTKHIKHLYKKVFLVLFCISVSSCTEQYVFQSNTFESILVVQANITNELKTQEIKITRSYRLEEYGPPTEEGVNVYVTEDGSKSYEFEFEKVTGLYVSKAPFQAVPEKSYQLHFTTKEGKSYSSSIETLTPVNEINVEPKIETIDGEKGVQIRVTSFDPSAKSLFYRYEYDETYKIVAPDWKPNKLIVAPFTTNGFPDFIVVPREEETRVCFTTKKSDNLILANTTDLSEDRIDLPIRFIGITEPILNERYSIIVRQYVQSLESYTYYNTLKKLSSSESIFSQVQPGFNYGNLKSDDNADEKIVGYFEVSSVSSKRIFFNFRDIFAADPYPPYYIPCVPEELQNCWDAPGCGGPKILSIVKSPKTAGAYYGRFDDIFVFVPSPCGDCTSFSSNIRPLFWID